MRDRIKEMANGLDNIHDKLVEIQTDGIINGYTDQSPGYLMRRLDVVLHTWGSRCYKGCCP